MADRPASRLRSVLANVLVFAALVLVSLSALREVRAYRERTSRPPPQQPWSAALHSLVTPATADALARDPSLRRNLISLVDLTSDLTRVLSSDARLSELRRTRDVLDEYRRALAADVDPEAERERDGHGRMRRDIIGDILDGLTGGVGSIVDSITGLFGNITDDMLETLAEPSLFLGIGLGEGTAQGLKLASAKEAQEVGEKVAADYNATSDGLSPVVHNLGKGLTASLLGNIKLGGGDGGNGSGGDGGSDPLGGLAGFLKLEDTALNLGLGLGYGASRGLNLTAKDVKPAKTGEIIPDAAGMFAYGLGRSLTENINLGDALGPMSAADDGGGEGGLGPAVMKYLPDAASGLGRGLGAGIPIGLGLQPDIPAEVRTGADNPGDDVDVEAVAENFARGLSSALLANGTLDKALKRLGGSDGKAAASTNGESSDEDGPLAGLPGNLNLGSMAQGLARGLVQGVGDGIDRAGGIDKLLHTTSRPVEGLPMPNGTTIWFDDSVGGAAVGFGQGLGGQTIIVAQQLFSKGSPASAEARSVRSENAHSPVAVGTREVVGHRQLHSRAFGVTLSELINSGSVTAVGRVVVDGLTCRGIGGVILVATKLMRGNLLGGDGGNSTDGSMLDTALKLVPSISVTLSSEGNSFAFDGAKLREEGITAGISVNGNGFGGLLGLASAHITVGVLVFLFLVPTAIGLEQGRSIVVRLRKPHLLGGVPRSVGIMWYLLVFPSLIVLMATGPLMLNGRTHFRTPHQVLGLLTAIFGIVAIVLHFFAKSRDSTNFLVRRAYTITKHLVLLLGILACLTGFGALSSLVLCATQVVPFELAVVLGFVLMVGVAACYTVVGMDAFLAVRQQGEEKRGEAGDMAAAGGTLEIGRDMGYGDDKLIAMRRNTADGETPW